MKVLVLVKATPESEAGRMPPPGLLEAMGRFNQEMVQAGVMKAADGLKPSSAGRRVSLGGDTRDVVPGPFSGDVVSGYWIWEVADLEEAERWALRCPTSPHGPRELELRPVYGPEDFADATTPELQALEAALRERAQG